MNSVKQQGFTLIEVLVSIVVFAIGLLGMANSIGQSMHISMDNNTRAMLSSVASQIVEPLYISANNVATGTITETEFIASLASIDGASVTSNGGRDTFDIKITQALDDDDNNALTVLPISPPIRVVVEVSYQGLNDVKTTKTNYTFVW